MSTKVKGPPPLARIIIAWIALVTMIACNALFEVLRLGGTTSAEVSNQVFTWFMPAGYVFSIWGVIYVALVIFMIAETRRYRTGNVLSWRNTLLFAVSCGLNIAWLAVFHFQQIPLSVGILVALWIVLAMLYISLRDDEQRTRLSLAPFSLYFAWSTVAVIINTTNFATRLVESPLIVNQVSTILLASAVMVVSYLSARNSEDFVFPLVTIWALVGVGVNLMGMDIMVSLAVFVITIVGAYVTYAPLIMGEKDKGEDSLIG